MVFLCFWCVKQKRIKDAEERGSSVYKAPIRGPVV